MSKGTYITVSTEQYAAVQHAAEHLGVTTSTITNILLQPIVSAVEQALGANRIEHLKNQDAPEPTAIVSSAQLPVSAHTMRKVVMLSKVLQVSKEVIALWSIHYMLPSVEKVPALNRHTLPPVLINKINAIERTPNGTTRDRA